MASHEPFYHGNAAIDSVGATGWFLGQFVPAAAGLRHQTDLELKWGIHRGGERRGGGWHANGVATTVSVLVRGALKISFRLDGAMREVELRNEGDYVVFGPELAHDWEALLDSVVLSVRFPSVDVLGSAAPPAAPPHGG